MQGEDLHKKLNVFTSRRDELLKQQEIDQVLGDIVETKAFAGEFQRVQKYYPYAIQIKESKENDQYVVRFFEYIFRMLISYQGVETSDEEQIKHIASASSNKQYIEQILDSWNPETEISKSQKELLQNFYDAFLKDEDYDGLKYILHVPKPEEVAQKQLVDALFTKPNQTFYEDLVKLKIPGSVQSKFDFESDLGGPKNEKDTLGIIVTEGDRPYKNLLPKINDLLKKNKCLYPICAQYLKSYTKGQGFPNTVLQENDQLRLLEQQYEQDERLVEFDKKIREEFEENFIKRYSSMQTVKHNDKYYILISKNVTEQFPFVKGDLRIKYENSLLEDFWSSILRRMISRIEKPGYDRFSSQERRLKDLQYWSLCDIQKIFELYTVLRARTWGEKGYVPLSPFQRRLYSSMYKFSCFAEWIMNGNVQNAVKANRSAYWNAYVLLQKHSLWEEEHKALKKLEERFFHDVPEKERIRGCKDVALRKYELLAWIENKDESEWNIIQQTTKDDTSQCFQSTNQVAAIELMALESLMGKIQDEMRFISQVAAEEPAKTNIVNSALSQQDLITQFLENSVSYKQKFLDVHGDALDPLRLITIVPQKLEEVFDASKQDITCLLLKVLTSLCEFQSLLKPLMYSLFIETLTKRKFYIKYGRIGEVSWQQETWDKALKCAGQDVAREEEQKNALKTPSSNDASTDVKINILKAIIIFACVVLLFSLLIFVFV